MSALGIRPIQEEIASAVRLLRAHAPDALSHESRLEMPGRRPQGKGGLAPWQVCHAKTVLKANLVGGIGIRQVSLECGLSTSHFSRAFRASTGVSPRRWLILCRLERARALLLQGEMPLCEIAIVCGFSNQSHFTHQFTHVIGIAPRAFRRRYSAEAALLGRAHVDALLKVHGKYTQKAPPQADLAASP